MPNYKRVFENGYSYFLTIITNQRNPILIENIELLRESFKDAKARYVFQIEAIVVLPDHIHMILKPEISYDYPYIIKTVKQYFSMYCHPQYYEHLYLSTSRIKRGHKAIWQKRYYEHTIRSETDFKTKLDYIHFNPVKHRLVKSVKDWKYSTFYQYVKNGFYDENWCNFDENIDFE